MTREPADHYRVLGVDPAATATEIRGAYRALARRHHPDRSANADDTMSAVNEAYRVLGDPARRAVYDAARRRPSSAATSPGATVASPSTPTTTPMPLPPARIPWRLVLAMFAVGATAVVVLAALARTPEPPPPDNLIGAGSCVIVEPNGDAREITCGDDPTQRIVRALEASAAECPPGTEAHRDRQGRGIACLDPPGATLPD